MSHTFHIPVLGLCFSVDTPVKVAKYGISSVASIVDDILIERMRKFYTEKIGEPFVPIHQNEEDSRARRISAYLNLINRIIETDFNLLKSQPFEPGSEITRYFELLPESSSLKMKYHRMLDTSDPAARISLQQELKDQMICGSIDVNIMAKVDKTNFNADKEPLADQFSDALASLRGFAESDLTSSVILSAGMNPRLYGYLENFACFFPDGQDKLQKRIILKVSDFRSAFIQAKFLAKKGLWVSEFRIESGLNCGGHAFATEGFLLGPILEEFKQRRPELLQDLYSLYLSGLKAKGINQARMPEMRMSVQGGIGTMEENNFLLSYYNMDGTGWGSPFLLVPEVTNVDNETLQNLVESTKDDFYISGSSPLGIPFNNFRRSSAEKQRLERIAKGRPGSPCKKKFLVSNTEFTEQPICTASREYQNLKIKQLQTFNLPAEEYKKRFDEITEKACLCEGLAASVYHKNDIKKVKDDEAVLICPGPNVAYFSGVFSLEEMVKHIYGKLNLLNDLQRPNMFINELHLYIDYLKKDFTNHLKDLTDKKEKYLLKFKDQLHNGIEYYKNLIPQINNQTAPYLDKIREQLLEAEARLHLIEIGKTVNL